ncbi:tail fiber protein [Escherichia phage EC167]|nr:tail fiber protein [Escherichia phage EC167]
MAIYRQGQASMDAQGYVTGYDTKWREQLTLIRPGATIFFLTQPLQAAVITEVISDTSIHAITTGGAVVQKTNYLILLHDSLTVDGLAQDVAETLRYYQSKEAVIEEAIEFFKDFDIDSLKQLADQVKQGAESAKQSAEAAKTSETNAVNARNDAEQFKNAAKASQDASANSATAAKGSQDAAKASEDKAKEYADSIQPGNFLVKSQNLADLQDKAKSRQNLSLDRFVQLSSNGETNMKSGDGTKQLFVKDNGDWGVWDNTSRNIVALSVAQGGTGGKTIPEAQRNLLIPDSGLDRVLVLEAPAGAEDKKYYPIIIHQPEDFSGNFLTEVEMTTPSRLGSEDPNCNTLRLWVRSGGWSDKGKVAFANFFAYSAYEVAILCVRGSSKGQFGHNAIYVRGDGFPVYLRKTPRSSVTVPTSDWSENPDASDKCVYKWGIENADDGIGDEYGCGNQLNFSNGLNGFYCNDFFRDGNGNPYLKQAMNYAGTIDMTISSLKLNGSFESTKTIKSNLGFVAEGIDVNGFTYRSSFRDGSILRNAEFRAASSGGEIVIRDPSGGSNHKFFGFGYDGSLSLSGAIRPGSPIDISYGGTGARDAEGIKNNIGLSATHSPTFAGVTIESPWPAVTCKTTQVDNAVIGKIICIENDASNALNVFFANGSDTSGRNTVAIPKPNSTLKMYVSFDGGLSPNGNSNIVGAGDERDMNVVPQGWLNVGGIYSNAPLSGDVYGSLFTQTTQGLSYGKTASQGVSGRWNQQRFYDTSNRIYTRIQTNASSWSAWAQVTTSAVSDERMKDVLGNLDVECALSNIERMEFKLFKFKDEHHTKEIRGATRRGVISQQIKQIDREYVKDVGGLWHLDQTPMLLDGLAAIKALRARDVDNKERISKLEKEVAELKELLSKLINNPTTLN